MYFRRNARQDVELRGDTIKAGEKISLWYISANRDEEVFDDPFRFDIGRDPNPHIAFGGGGPALLPGRPAGPARDPGAVRGAGAAGCPALESLGEPDRLRSNFIGGIKHLPVRLAPA